MTGLPSTVGAGDTFIAGILYGLLCHRDDWGASDTLGFGVKLATCKVQREGFAGVAAACTGSLSSSNT